MASQPMSCTLCGHVLTDGDRAPIVIHGEETQETWGPAYLWCPACRLPFVKARLRELAPDERPFARGDRVLVAGAAGAIMGYVIAAETPDELPDLGPASASHEAHQIMHEWHIDFVLVIGYMRQGERVGFIAMHHPGGWRDLKRQDLQIVKMEAHA